MIRLFDLVRLTHCPEWFGRVMAIEDNQAMVLTLPSYKTTWMRLEFLELRPGQEEEMFA